MLAWHGATHSSMATDSEAPEAREAESVNMPRQLQLELDRLGGLRIRS